MSAKIIDGTAHAERLRADIAARVRLLVGKFGYAPELAVVLVGDDPASQVYVRSKVRRTEEVGMRSQEVRLPSDTAESVVVETVRALSLDPHVDGILVQLPLPRHINPDNVIAAIAPEKDVDGLTPASAGALALGMPGLRPCTPTGCVMLARSAASDMKGAHCVILGRSILVGKPAAQLFLSEDCTTTIAHSRTKDLRSVLQSADILVAAAGQPALVKAEYLKQGAVVIDVGINRVQIPDSTRSRLVGDVDFDAALEVAGAITPVPGGVGPMTIACLLQNTLLAACARRNWSLGHLSERFSALQPVQ